MSERTWVNCCLRRKSTREYNGKSISKEARDKIMKFTKEVMEEEHPWRTHKNIRVYFTKNDFGGGNISNCTDFLAIISSKNSSREELMECGYIFQKIILYCEKLGLQTCWVGGRWLTDKFDSYYSKNKESLEIEFDKKKEKVICVTPVGFARVKDNLRSVRYKPERLFFDGDTKKLLKNNVSKEYKIILDCFRRSPSACNMQRWRVVKDDDKRINTFHFFTKPSSNFYTNIDIGIGIANFSVAARELGVRGSLVKLDSKIMEGKKMKMFGRKNKKDSSWFGIGNYLYGIGYSAYERWSFKKLKGTGECLYFMSWIEEEEEEEEGEEDDDDDDDDV